MADHPELDTDLERSWTQSFRGTLCRDDLERFQTLIDGLPRQQWTVSGSLSAGDDGRGAVRAPTLKGLVDERFELRHSTTLAVQAGQQASTVTVRLQRVRDEPAWEFYVFAEGDRLRKDYNRIVRGLGEIIRDCDHRTWSQRLIVKHPGVAGLWSQLLLLSVIAGIASSVVPLLFLTNGALSVSEAWAWAAVLSVSIVLILTFSKLVRLESWKPPAFDLLRPRPVSEGWQPPQFLARDVAIGAIGVAATAVFTIVAIVVS